MSRSAKDPSKERAVRTFCEKAVSALASTCPVCRAGWGLCCRTYTGGLTFHPERLQSWRHAGATPIAIQGPSHREWAVLKARAMAATLGANAALQVVAPEERSP